jgi:hypothetical protein
MTTDDPREPAGWDILGPMNTPTTPTSHRVFGVGLPTERWEATLTQADAAAIETEARTAADLIVALRRVVPSVVQSHYVPRGEVYVLNDLGLDDRRPADWDAMDALAKVRWAIENGMTVIVSATLEGTSDAE